MIRGNYMAEIGHSTLLKYFTDTSKMSDLTGDAIKSNVPGEQKLRGVDSATAIDIEPNDDSSKDDFVLTPVMNVTKEELTWTKGGMKLQKVVVSGETSNESTTVNTTMSVTESTGVNTVRTETTEVNVTVTSNNSNENGTQEEVFVYDAETGERIYGESKKSTKIPKLKLRRAFDKIRREEQMSQEKTIHEPYLAMKVRSAIPRLKDLKHQQNAQENLTKNEEVPNENSPKLDDEFDKLYEETVENDPFNNSRPVSEQFDELSKIETKFEEIIHSYEDNKVQQVATEKVKSKIPLLKRKSEQEIEVRPQNRRSSLKKSLSIEDNKGKIPVATKEKAIKTDVETSKIIKSKALSESSTSTKSETVSTTKHRAETFTTQLSTTTKEVSVSSKDKVEIKQNTTTTPKDVSKTNIPVSQHTKEKLERKISNNTEKLSEQVTTERSTLLIDGKSVENEVDDIKSLKKNETQTEVKTTENISSKVSTSFSKSQSFDQSSYTTENISVKETTDDLKVTEISKINVEIQNVGTTEVKETIKVATLKYDNSLSAESETILNNNKNILSNENTDEKGTLNENCDITIKEIKKETTVSSNATEIESTIENKKFIENYISQRLSHLDSNEHVANSNNDVKIEQNNAKEKEVTTTKIENESVKSSKDNLNDSFTNNNNQLQQDLTITSSRLVKSLSINDNINKHNIAQETTTETIQVQNTQKEKDAVLITKQENTEKTDKTQVPVKETEAKQTINALEANHINTKDNNTVNSEVKIKDNGNDKKSLTNLSSQVKNIDDLEEEDIIILKGKVNRIISRLDSREQQVIKTEVDDIPKDVCVSSKIANFEKSRQTETLYEDKTNNLDETDNDRKDKPKIVDEILKSDTGLDINHNKQNSIVDSNDATKHNDKTKDSNDLDKTNPFDYTNAFDNNKFQSNYYKVYNKVHSSIVKRLNSIEKKFNESDISERNETKYETIKENDDICKDNNNLRETKSLSEPNFFKNKNPNENEDVFTDKKEKPKVDMYKEYRVKELDVDQRAKSLAELDLGDAVRGRVRQMVYRMNSMERMRLMRSDTVERKERLRKISITDRVALFEKKVVPIYTDDTSTHRKAPKPTTTNIQVLSDEKLQEKITELKNAKIKYGKFENMTSIELRDGSSMPVIALGTALLEPKLIKHVICAAIDLGYRAIDTAYIYGNEKFIGEAIQAKIDDGTVTRDELYIISKLWSTFHRRDLVTKACKKSLEAMGLEYFDLYLIHNPMSFKEGGNPIPKIANVLQYSEHDYLEAWYGIEDLIRKGLVKRGGVSNFNSVQVERVVDKGKIKPVVNQVECHPYLTQQRLDDFCTTRNVKLSCFGVLGSKGTPLELKSGLPPAIDDPLVKVMSAGLGVKPGQLLIAYQIQTGRNVVVKTTSADHMWDNLQALNVKLDQSHISALNALNRNKRTFTFEGMGDTHRNYPFKIAY
ncbi:serine-rich adhesin for platelets-like isoform X1 [Vanessa cardui]|uniref:serine-rich adhesin for platelets-like isoform X1 n=1 Tax=Vanessa cardui TaxID=171605 RepID=UPI001F142E61|nr:serine-rich adhesin for platelets-like isoform X1 [Vanessa cardui]